jgi:hypothetical protein
MATHNTTPSMDGDPLVHPIHGWGSVDGWGTPSRDGVAIHEQTHFDHPNYGQLLFPYGVTPTVDSQVLIDRVTLLVTA